MWQWHVASVQSHDGNGSEHSAGQGRAAAAAAAAAAAMAGRPTHRLDGVVLHSAAQAVKDLHCSQLTHSEGRRGGRRWEAEGGVRAEEG